MAGDYCLREVLSARLGRQGRDRGAADASRISLSRRAKIHRRRQLEEAIEAALAALDALDGDTDLEPQCEDEGAACEDEGAPDDREPEPFNTCHWQDEGDQTTLRPHAMFVHPARDDRRHQNIGDLVPIGTGPRVLLRLNRNPRAGRG